MANESFPYRAGRYLRNLPGDIIEADRIIRETALGGVVGAAQAGQEGVSDFAGGIMGTPVQTRPRVPANIQEAAAAPRMPNPPSAPRTTVPRIDEWARELDERERAYAQNPEAWEQKRMAAPPTSGELRYSVGGGPMKSYNAGMNRTDVKGDPDFARFRDDDIFGQHVAGRLGGGGVSTPGGNDDEAYANYRRNLMGDAAYAQEQAGTARDEMLARDPFAREEFEIEKAIRLQDAQTRNTYDRERLRQQAEQDFRAGVLGQQSEVEQYAESERQRMRSTPQYMNAPMEQKAQMEKAIDDWLSSERARLGIPEGAEWNRIG